MSPNKKPVFYIALALGALIFLPLLLWLFTLPFRTPDYPANLPDSTKPSSALSTPENTDFSLRQKAERARAFIDGELAEAARSGNLSLDAILALGRDLEKADSALASGKKEKAGKLYQSIIRQAEHILISLEQADKARRMLDDTYQRLSELEALKEVFATSYAEAVIAFDLGQQKLSEHSYADSVDSFVKAETVLDDLEEHSIQQVQTFLEEAQRAVENYDLDAATSAYRAVLGISPAQPDALSGLALVDLLQGIASEIQVIDVLEEAGQLDEALDNLERLLAQMPGNDFLLSRQKAIQEKIVQRDFSALINQANLAEAAGDFPAAVSALESALTISSDPEVTIRLEALKKQIKDARLETLLAEGFNALHAGRYEAARDAYKEALDLAPESTEASTGYEKASGLLLAGIRYKQNLATASKYIESGRFPLAAKFYNKAMAARPARLTIQQEKDEAAIRETIQRESQTVNIRIISDDRTFVSITGVFPPEKFKSKELNLFPDVYTVKATRNGYHTVEKTLHINTAKANEAITVICTERE